MHEPKRAAPRLFVEGALEEDSEIGLSEAQAHYLLQVLRLKSADHVILFNGRHGEWIGSISSTSRKAASVRLDKRLKAQPSVPDLWFLFAPLKSARLDYLVQKAVEMGASEVIPVLTERTQVQRFNADRARANMIEAAEQCEILNLPRLHAEEKLHKLLSRWPGERRMIFCDEVAPLANPVDALGALTMGEPRAVIIGPEGGFSASERQSLLALPRVTRLSLGPRILRADTAAVAALALIQGIAGDWKG